MSGFDDNPFGDNPFQDPSITQATQGAANAEKDLEDYNPFDNNPQNARPTTVPIPADDFDPVVRGASNPPGGFTQQSPAVMSPTTQEIPASRTNQAPPQISTADLQRRQEELERKERELQRREEELRSIPYNARQNNWPPLPDKFPVKPCFYQDINVDIPVEFQRIVRYLYYLWVLHGLVLIVNAAVFMLRMFALAEGRDFYGFALALVYIFIFTPSSYVCWFRPAYKAFRSDSSFNFVVFFFIFFFQFIVSVLMSVYMEGSNGIVGGIGIIKEGGVGGIIVGILVVLVGMSFVACAVLDFILLVRIHRVYRSTGASISKAQQEFASGVMRNEHVQGAVANMAAEGVRAGVNSVVTNNTNNAARY